MNKILFFVDILGFCDEKLCYNLVKIRQVFQNVCKSNDFFFRFSSKTIKQVDLHFMIIFKLDEQIKKYIEKLKDAGKSIGFVPTMGALHEGHIQLVKEAVRNCDICVVSIFINSTQFNVKEDLTNYPITTSEDINLLEKNGCHILYLPTEEIIYPSNGSNSISHHIGPMEHLLEGVFRPGHYKGVVQVVNILLETISPNNLFLGAKDYQQCRVLTQFVGMNFSHIKVEIVPTVRAESGLALSSRNRRLSAAELTIAPIIYKSLLNIKKQLKQGDLSPLEKEATSTLIKNGLQPEYVVIADATNLEKIKNWNGTTKFVELIAAKLGAVRLIDNLELN